MGLGSIVLAVIIATVLTLIFAAGFQRTGPWPHWLAFFLLVFLLTVIVLGHAMRSTPAA